MTAAFDKGQKAEIVLINKSRQPLPIGMSRLIEIMYTYIDEYIKPIWNVSVTLSSDTDFVSGKWGIVLIDNPFVANIMGCHELTPDGLPLGYVFIEPANNRKEPLTISLGHELAEMLIDPGLQMGAQSTDGRWYAYEICDPVEGTTFEANGFPLPNFVYPAYFESFRPKGYKFDYLDKLKLPFSIVKGGYIPYWYRAKWWVKKNTTKMKHRFEREDFINKFRTNARIDNIYRNGNEIGLRKSKDS